MRAFSSPPAAGHADLPYFELLILSGALLNHCVDQPVFTSRFGAHEIITIGIALDFFQGASTVLGHQYVETLTDEEDFLGVNFDVRRLALETAQWLVNHHTRVRQAVTLALGTSGQQESAHAARLTNTGGGHVRLDELHGVVDRHTRRHRTTWRVDVKMNVLVRIFRFKEQQLRTDQVGHVVLYRADKKDHSLLEQARIDIVGALTASRLLDNHGYQAASGLDIRHLLHKRIAGHACTRSLNSHVTNTHKPARRLAYGVFERGKEIRRLAELPPA